ncbi:MAG: type II toxin-antitoxin system ParD family antitoxin [Pirellulales bacterium]
MSISLTPDLYRQVQERLATGIYRSEEEVLQAALRALDAEEQTLAAIAEGYADFEAGRTRPFDEADAEFRNRHGLAEEP